MTDEELQKYWDACLIKQWRTFGTVSDAVQMFFSITGVQINDANILRKPNKHMPWRMQVQYFVAHFLPKINDALWRTKPDTDAKLLSKLQQSTYDTFKNAFHSPSDREVQNKQRADKRNRKYMAVELQNKLTRNHDTDWNVTKGPVRTRRAR